MSTTSKAYVSITRETTLEDDTVVGEEEIEVEAWYTAGVPATHDQPAEHAQVDIVSATINGEEVELTYDEEDRIAAKILSNPPERDSDY